MADSLDITWPLLLEPGMDDLAEGATDVLKKMVDDLKIYPFQDKDRKDRLFLGRFELTNYQESFQFSEAFDAFKSNRPSDPAGFIDFLGGFPIDCIEMLVLIGEYSSKAKEGEASKVNVQAGTGVTAPVPPKGSKGFFKWPEKDKVLLNLTAIPTKGVAVILAKNLSGEPKPKKVHFWFRVALLPGTEAEPRKYPVPGEFVGLGVRMFPDSYWGKQKSSPFVYSGNWLATVYYDSAVIKEIQDPTDDASWPTYTVTWRGREIKGVKPSDFTLYKVNDRVTLLKDVTVTKKTQLWKDDDMKADCDKSKWVIAPICYYGLDRPAGG